MFARHGFHNVAERVKLGRFIVERVLAGDIEKLSAAERVRLSFEELGPTFVKLGQLLATRPDLVPEDYVREFEKLHDRVQPLPFEMMEAVIKEELGPILFKKLASIDPNPVGSASMAQVHKAQLITGEEIVIKVQRPGIIHVINDDLNVLYMLAELLEKYVPETRPFSPMAIVDEYFQTLELETNFVVEGNNIRRFQQSFASNPKVKIPKVYFDLTTERILVMEALHGIPLSQDEALKQEGTVPGDIIRLGLSVYLKMVFQDGLFHGDLHAGNFFVLPNNHIGLIDFGAVGRLNSRTQAAIASMLVALSKEDYERLAYEYVDLAPFTDQVNVDIFAKELRQLIAPYYGLTLRNVNLGKLLMASSSLAARHHLMLPTELMMFFRSLVAIEGIGRRIDRNFDFLQHSLAFASELVKSQFDSNRIMNEVVQVMRESKNFINALPRQLNFLIRKLNSPHHFFQIELRGFNDLRRAVEGSFNLLFLGIIIAALIISGSIILSTQNAEAVLLGLPTSSAVLYILAAILSFVGFFHYIRK